MNLPGFAVSSPTQSANYRETDVSMMLSLEVNCRDFEGEKRKSGDESCKLEKFQSEW